MHLRYNSVILASVVVRVTFSVPIGTTWAISVQPCIKILRPALDRAMIVLLAELVISVTFNVPFWNHMSYISTPLPLSYYYHSVTPGPRCFDIAHKVLEKEY